MFHTLNRTYLSIFRSYPILIRLALITACGQCGYSIVANYALPLRVNGLAGLAKPGATLGLLTSCFLLAELATKLPWGHLSDRLGRKPFLVLGPLLSCFSPVLIALLPGRLFRLFFPLRIVDGIGAGALWPSLFAGVGDRIKVESRGAAMSILNTTYIIGLGLGVAFADTLYKLTGDIGLVFFLASGLLVCAGIMAVLGIPRGESAPGQEPEAQQVAEQRPASPRSGRPLVATILFITFAQSLAMVALAPFMVLYAFHDLHLAQSNLGVIFLGPAALGVALGLPLGHLADRWGRARAIKLSLLLVAGAMWMLPQFHTLAPVMVLLTFIMLAYLLGAAAWAALLSQVFPEAKQGKAMGAMSTTQSAGALLGPLIGGHLWDLNHHYPFFFSAGVISVSVLVAFIAIYDPIRVGGDR